MPTNKEISEYYDKYVTRQKRIGVNERHKSMFRIIKQKGLFPTDKILEIGCGIGTFTSLLIPFIKLGKITAMDISTESIKLAKKKYSENNLEFIKADATLYDFGKSLFDVIILPDVIEHIPINFHSNLFKKLESVLTDKGYIFIHIPNPYYLIWCHENKPEALQVIDQPITTDILIENTYKHNLIIEELKTYSIWVKDHDYQYIVLRKNGYQDFSKTIEYKTKLLDKVKYKLNAFRK